MGFKKSDSPLLSLKRKILINGERATLDLSTTLPYPTGARRFEFRVNTISSDGGASKPVETYEQVFGSMRVSIFGVQMPSLKFYSHHFHMGLFYDSHSGTIEQMRFEAELYTSGETEKQYEVLYEKAEDKPAKWSCPYIKSDKTSDEACHDFTEALGILPLLTKSVLYGDDFDLTFAEQTSGTTLILRLSEQDPPKQLPDYSAYLKHLGL